MAKEFNHNEIIETYLEGSMPAGERSAFEKQIASDPVLKQEVEVQRNIIEGIREYRKAELKSMLNDVPVSSGTSSMGLKLGAIAIAALVLISGGYYWYSQQYSLQPDMKITAQDISNSPSLPAATVPSLPEGNIAPAIDEALPQASAEIAQPVEAPAAVRAEPQADEKTETKQRVTVNAIKPTVPELTNDEPEAAETFDQPEAAFGAKAVMVPSSVSFETRKHKKYSFHYQFDKENNLILFADFGQDPFEILEINSGDDRYLYLYYNDMFYPIDDSERKVIPLIPLTDETRIKDLRIMLKNK